MRIRPLALIVPVMLIAPTLATAQPSATGETGLFTVPSTGTLARRTWSFGLYYNNRDRVIDLDDSVFGDVSDPEINWNRLSVAFAYGLTDRLEVAAALPFDDYTFSHDEGLYGEEFDAAGPNNLRIAGKYRFWEHPATGTRLAVNPFAELPTGDSDEVASSGPGFGVLLVGETRSFVYNLGWRDPGNSEDFDNPQQLLIGGGYTRRVIERMDWISELNLTWLVGGDDTLAPIQSSFDLTTGGRVWFQSERPWSLNFALRLNMNGLSGLGGLVGVTFGAR